MPGGRYAQAFITTSNLPDTLERLLDWVDPDPWNAGTPVDQVLGFDPSDPLRWTAPARVGRGDFAFFHFAARASARVVNLSRVARRSGALDPGLADFLEHAAEHAELFAGRIFAFGVLAGPAVPDLMAAEDDRHWRSRLFAPIASVASLDVPLLLREHSDALPQPTRTITELTAAQFAALKERLVEIGNELPAELSSALPGRDDFGGISATTWREMSCGADAMFGHEADVRGFFADWLLAEVKDPGTEIYSEARCVSPEVSTKRRRGGAATRAGSRAGAARGSGAARADYIIQVNGEWIPVETKLSLWAWPDILEQVEQYVSAPAFEVRDRAGAVVRLPASRHRAALVIDRHGLYVVRDGGFAGCGPGEPIISRTEMEGVSAKALRTRVQELVKEAGRRGRSR